MRNWINQVDWESVAFFLIAGGTPFAMATVVIIWMNWWTISLFILSLPLPIFPTGVGPVPITLGIFCLIMDGMEKVKGRS